MTSSWPPARPWLGIRGHPGTLLAVTPTEQPETLVTTGVRTASAAETRAFGAWLAEVAEAGDRIELLGTLGAGKTQLAKGFAVGLGVSETVNSPSFTLMSEYEGRLPLFHQDLYRLAGASEAFEGGLLDERQDLGVTLTEWADRLGPDAAPEHLGIRLRVAPDGSATSDGAVDDAPVVDGVDTDGVTDEVRWLELEAPPRYVRYIDRARAWAARA